MRVRNFLFSGIVLVVSFALSLAAAELLLRVKNSSMTNYDIEMWRYAKELKIKSPDEALDFDHVRSQSALLQNVEIRLNDWGLRGKDVGSVPLDQRRILFLGRSITLGWGVPEEETVESRPERMLSAAGESALVLNGGVGNYNSERYVSRFLKQLTGLRPTDIVVHYFLRDAEDLPPGGGNFVLRNSELAVTLWIAFHEFFDKQGEASLTDHYRKVYQDLLPAFLGHSPQELWAMPGDPHPNALGHELMAKAIFPFLVLNGKAEKR